ncbi:MAG: thermonuclease family protein [Pseudomonadota bacterium]
MRRNRIKDFLKLTLFLAVMAIASAWLAAYNTDEITGMARVVDGDSLVVSGREVRLYGIDAPEFRQNCGSVAGDEAPYACGRKAAAFLKELIAGRVVTCRGNEIDKYDRLLAVCEVASVHLNKEMVSQGWAVAFGSYEREEASAKKMSLGLWAGKFDLPSQWRRAEKQEHSGGWLNALFPQ